MLRWAHLSVCLRMLNRNDNGLMLIFNVFNELNWVELSWIVLSFAFFCSISFTCSLIRSLPLRMQCRCKCNFHVLSSSQANYIETDKLENFRFNPMINKHTSAATVLPLLIHILFYYLFVCVFVCVSQKSAIVIYSNCYVIMIACSWLVIIRNTETNYGVVNQLNCDLPTKK